MDICISHLYNRQIRKNILQDVFYKLENYDNEEFLCFDVNASGSLLVAASKTSLYFFHILTGTLLLQHTYYDENEKEDYLKRDIFEEEKIHGSTCSGVNDKDSNESGQHEAVKSVGLDEGNEYDIEKEIENENSTSGNITRNDNISSNEFSNILDNINSNEVGSASGIGNPDYDERASHIDGANNVNQATCVDQANHLDHAKDVDPLAMCYDLGNDKDRQSPNCDEDLKTTKEEEESYETPNAAIQNGNYLPDNFLTQNDSICYDDSVKAHKRKLLALKGQKSKKVKKSSRKSQKSMSRSGENITNLRSKNNESSSRKSADDKFEDENAHIKKIQFIKHDKYLLGVSTRYLSIFKICEFPIIRIVYMDLLCLCIGIETIISKKLFFPCFFSEYFYLLYKENEYKQTVEGSLLNSSSLSNDFSRPFGSNSDVSINKFEEISECSKNCKEMESPPFRGYQEEATPGKGHLSLFKDYYKIYTGLNFSKIRNFEICEVKCVDFKKKKRSSGDEGGNIYVLDLVLCLKEQIPYVTRVYVEDMADPSGQYETSLPDVHHLASYAERMNDFIVDVNVTHPIISYEQMNFTFEEIARESSLHVRKDILYSKSKSKNKKKCVKGGGSKNFEYNEIHGVSKMEECSAARLGEAILSEAVVDGGGATELVSAATTRLPSGMPTTALSEVTIGNTKTVEPTESYISSSNFLPRQTQREGASVCEDKDEEAMQLMKFFEHYENSRKFLKKMLSGYFPICVYKKRSKRRSKELPTTLNIYDNLDALLKGKSLRGNIPRGEEKDGEIFEKVNDYYTFDYSGREKTDYFNFPHSLLKNKNSLKNVNKHRDIDKNKHYIYVGTPSYVLAFEMHYVKKCATVQEEENNKAESPKRNNLVYSKIECISDEICRTHDNYLRNVQEKNLFDEKIELSFLFKVYLGITTPLDIAIREKGNLLCVRTLEKVFLYKLTYKYSVHCMGGGSHSNIVTVSDERNSLEQCTTGEVPSQLANNIPSCIVANKSCPTQGGKHDDLYSYIDRICLYHTIHNPIQKEVHELCCFSEDIYQSYLLVVSLKSGQYTLYIYDLKHMDLQNAMKVNISAYKGFKQIRWIKCYDMLVALSTIGNYLVVLKNKHLNNWSFFISDFELIGSNIEFIEEENEFDIIENIQPKHKHIDNHIWKYIIIYINLFIKNKISIQNLSHPSSLFPILYTGYYKSSPMYFFYKSCYHFGKENFLCYEVDESTEQESQDGEEWTRTKKKKKKTLEKGKEDEIKQMEENRKHSFLQIRENLDHYVDSPFQEPEEDNQNNLFVKDNSNSVELLAPEMLYYLYYKNIVNFSL
ncbi:hypothetical protein AK88_00954 [Plasmodium fragile]|uniref:Uncharacterized protein n=1 Tax=Plasmodium fragile TaxID=5857 RepID=A0A0D9QR73_PLAFR|nr:uncharacterized protein AK88_00954 [Plasmodium fragile]KJP89292.1 hypothetical protein AK88_00954 [Plasmodium fragile]